MNISTAPDAPSSDDYLLPYDPDEFAARSEEIELVSQKVSTRRIEGDHRITRPLVEFYSVLGQGKSWLLAHLRDKFRHDPQVGSSLTSTPPPRPSFSVLVDLREFQHWRRASALLQTLIDQLREQPGEATAGELPIPSSDEQVEATAEALGKYLRDLGRSWVPVLLFDTADRADEEFLDWIEDHLIYHAIRDDTVVFAFAGRTRLRWKKFEVRRRVEPRELPPFDQPQTGEQIERLRGEELPDELTAALWGYSFGHPLTTRVIYDTLCRLNPEAPLDAIGTRETGIAQAVHNLIENHFLSVVARPELRELIWDTCALRKFNVAHLREFAGDETAAHSEAFYLNLIRDLVASTLVRWSSMAGGYVLDHVVRQIMARNLQMQEPERYREQHKKAVAMYEEWAQEHPRNAGDFLIEWIYHQAEVWQMQKMPDDEIASQLAQKFQGQLDQLRKEPQIQWDLPDVARTLDERLLKREDVDLRIALSGLRKAIEPFVTQYA
jgi:hypothetical protein